jgi:hypothetical protein
MLKLIRDEFKRGATLPVLDFPADGAAVGDSPRLTLVILDPDTDWNRDNALERNLAEWTKKRADADRSYPGALIWCVKKPGLALREKVELWQAWRKVEQEINSGVLAGEFEMADRTNVKDRVKEAAEDARDSVWADYTFVFLADREKESGIEKIDLGAGHSSETETLCGRVVTALKHQSLLNESISVGYLERRWPEALRESGAWPLSGLRQSFLNGSLTRLLDPDAELRKKIVQFVSSGEFGLAYGQKPDGTYQRLWFNETVAPEEVSFDADVFLLQKERAKELKSAVKPSTGLAVPHGERPEEYGAHIEEPKVGGGEEGVTVEPSAAKRLLRISGHVPPELWNRLGNRLLPKLRINQSLKVKVDFSLEIAAEEADRLQRELRQALSDLGLRDAVQIGVGLNKPEASVAHDEDGSQSVGRP